MDRHHHHHHHHHRHPAPSDSGEMPFFDLESERLDFVEHYILDASSDDTDSSVFDCNLDESFRQIKEDLERLHGSTPKKPASHRRMACGESSSVVDDNEYAEIIDINEMFDVMKDRVRNFRAKETETLRKYILELNSTIDCVTNSEGKTYAPVQILIGTYELF